MKQKIRQLHETMEAAVQTAADAEKWIALMKQYVNPVELTAELLNTLIEKNNRPPKLSRARTEVVSRK